MLWESVVEHGHGKKKSKWISSFFPFVIREYGKDWCRHRKGTQHFRDQQPAMFKSWHTSRIPRLDFRVLEFVSFSRLVRKSPARVAYSVDLIDIIPTCQQQQSTTQPPRHPPLPASKLQNATSNSSTIQTHPTHLLAVALELSSVRSATLANSSFGVWSDMQSTPLLVP